MESMWRVQQEQSRRGVLSHFCVASSACFLPRTLLGGVSQRTKTLSALRSHKWTGCQLGGHPADVTSYEWVRYCEVCGMEDTGEDPLPPCPGA